MKWLFVSGNVGVCLGQIRSCDVVFSFDICPGKVEPLLFPSRRKP